MDADPVRKYDTRGAAARLGLVPQTLANWRHLSKGPPYYKVGDRIFYRSDDLNQFEESGRIDPQMRK
ncbi:MAG: helix-turn-helix domain-containing protein [Burkholderiaceae bacterium]|jgi:hypothetical protein|nr:helix-turn-helix domain-containing protein [Burkholderiaceae bacterium]